MFSCMLNAFPAFELTFIADMNREKSISPKPWLEPETMVWLGWLAALALAWDLVGQSPPKPSPSHGFRAKPSLHNTNQTVAS